ncbi:TetR family transcriptional regulator [Zhengella mangrovi]|uniref:TetR family transcriptional regulator n=1 Tax=Zhengella mangrovi TaxID=1982044 RepID=A0A2G1QNZ3_9HYPH|nr:TetR/AcrR family transcriptional regulator [Zhengella mangrovi]PHP67184.1 TetR family transcriptional regulator [Zhengella mangrovi]
MTAPQAAETTRKRAPSKRSLATRDRVLDAAERVFADKGFDGATIRDIAETAGEPIGSVHHHGGGKEMLFHQVVKRRAEPLARARLDALKTLRRDGHPGLETLLSAFLRPLFDLAKDEPRWRHYARLVAYVSADDRWRAIARDCFDPTAAIFLEEIAALLPGITRNEAAEGFVFSVSAMLALATSQQRIGALGGGEAADEAAQIDHLIRFCAGGLSNRRARD